MKQLLLFLTLTAILSQNAFSQQKIWDETEEEKTERGFRMKITKNISSCLIPICSILPNGPKKQKLPG